MPLVFRDGPYHFSFFAADESEPPHVHIKRDNLKAKYWLSPLKRADGGRFSEVELRRIEKILQERRTELLEAWHDFFGNT
jgi:hypothetical protein